MDKKENFKQEKDFLETLKDIKRKRKDDEENLYTKLMEIIENTPGDEKKKETLKILIDNLDKNIKDMNPIAFVMEVNILFSRLLFIAKSKKLSVPSELLVPYLNINESPDVWLNNLKDGIIPYMVKGELFDIIKIKGIGND